MVGLQWLDGYTAPRHVYMFLRSEQSRLAHLSVNVAWRLTIDPAACRTGHLDSKAESGFADVRSTISGRRCSTSSIRVPEAGTGWFSPAAVSMNTVWRLPGGGRFGALMKQDVIGPHPWPYQSVVESKGVGINERCPADAG